MPLLTGTKLGSWRRWREFQPTRCMKSICFLSVTLLAVYIVGCGTARRDSVTENKSVVLRSEKELWSSGNLAAADELYSTDFVCHFIIGPEWRGVEGIKNEVRQHRISFPEWNERVDGPTVTRSS
jgi:hypothetical protein